MPGDNRLRNLAVAQIALGVVAGVLAPVKLPDPSGWLSILPPFGLDHILIVPLFALALCQALLIALWGTASTASPWKRLAGLVAGAVYLEALPFPDLRREFLGLSPSRSPSARRPCSWGGHWESGSPGEAAGISPHRPRRRG